MCRILQKIDEIVRRFVYWITFFGLVWTAMSWVAAHITWISEYGWGAVVFAGVGAACVVTLVASGVLVAYRYFNPLSPGAEAARGCSGYAIYKRTHDATDLQPSAPVVTAQPKMPEQRQVWAGTIAAIAKPETETAEQLLPDQEKIRRAEILSKLRNKYPQRIIVDITPKFLMNLYKDKLTIEGDRAIAPYIGNWLLLSGPLDDVSGRTVMFGIEVTFEREFGEPFIHMYFDDLWIKRLHVLTPKQNIFALCQLTTAGSATAMFNHCELIDQDSGLPFGVP
jgi:hypothetical protein